MLQLGANNNECVLDSQPVPKPRNRYLSDNLQASRSPELPVQNFVPQAKQNISLPPSPSVPLPTDLIFTSADKNLAAKRSAVSNLKILNKIFPTKNFMATGNEVVKEEETRKGPDARLPDEYRPPPPFAPGYWAWVSSAAAIVAQRQN